MPLSPADEPVLRAATGSGRAPDRTIVILLIAALFGVLLIRLGLNALLPLADTTEARYGEIARVGVAHGYWLMPHSSPELPFFAKPPASTWLAMVSATLLGVSEFSLRLPSLLTMAIVILITMRLAAGGGPIAQVAPLFAALIVASAPLGFIAAGAVMTDAVQCLVVTVAMACATRLITASPDRRAIWRNGFWAAVGLGTLAKGLATVALIAFPIFLYGLALRTPWQTWRMFFSIRALALAMLHRTRLEGRSLRLGTYRADRHDLGLYRDVTRPLVAGLADPPWRKRFAQCRPGCPCAAGSVMVVVLDARAAAHVHLRPKHYLDLLPDRDRAFRAAAGAAPGDAVCLAPACRSSRGADLGCRPRGDRSGNVQPAECRFSPLSDGAGRST
jgi:hypothetical protein